MSSEQVTVQISDTQKSVIETGLKGKEMLCILNIIEIKYKGETTEL